MLHFDSIWLTDSFSLSAEALGKLSLFIGSGEFFGDLFVVFIGDRCYLPYTVIGTGCIFSVGFLALAIASLQAPSIVVACIVLFAIFFGFESAYVANLADSSHVPAHLRRK
jgi:hypothetical protein